MQSMKGNESPTRSDPEPTLVITKGIVVTGSRNEQATGSDVWISDAVISDIAPTGSKPIPAHCETIDATGMIVMPGLIDTHRHLWQTPLRGLGADLTGPEYRTSIRAAFGAHIRPEDVYIATLAGALEALDSGVTTILDWASIMNSPAHADASVAALRASGMRCVLAHGAPSDAEAASWWGNSERKHPGDIRRLRKEVLHDDAALVTMAFGARAPHLVTGDIMKHDWHLARELGLRITVDGGLGGGLWSGKRRYPIRLLREAGLLGADTTYVHCNNLAEDEYAAIADSGGTVSISPCAEMHVGHGVPATGRVLAAGIRPALSVDYVTQVAGDMFGAMRAILSTERGLAARAAFANGGGVEPWSLRTPDVLEFATAQGAIALGLQGRTGVLARGRQADITLLDTKSLRLTPVNDPVATIVLLATPADVDTVVVAGRPLKRGGRIVHTPVEKILAELVACRDGLNLRAGQHSVGKKNTSAWSW
jgi:cytosine/adenosine deaminase-related metal-dependent hydrolase